MKFDAIIDCYTDEPSGLGVPPYIGVHSRYIAGAITTLNRKYYYVTIDDLRYASGERQTGNAFNKRILNTTRNKEKVAEILKNAENIYLVMGCFVKYEYVSAEPGTFKEVNRLLNDLIHTKVNNIILFYSLGGALLSEKMQNKIIPKELFKTVVFGNTYNYFIKNQSNNVFEPNYDKLKNIAIASSSLLEQLYRPYIFEIETATGCNRNPGCTFCIEGKRGLPIQFRDEEDITLEIKALYEHGARYFRLGRQPNFYAYKKRDPRAIEKMFKLIWKYCPEIKTLHIDNAGPQDVNTEEGEQITKLIVKYCTDGNIAPFGVESFDQEVRKKCNLNGTIEDIFGAIEKINKYGKIRGESGMPKLLPGINIIYGLDGQTDKTLKINIESFKKILNSENWVRRVFVRKLTSPYGEQFDNYTEQNLTEFSEWQSKINEKFSIPMLKQLFPEGLIIKHLRMEMYDGKNSILRQMATCPVRVIIENQKLTLDKFYTIKVKNVIKNRTILGEIIESE